MLTELVVFIYGCVGKDSDKLVDLYSPQLDGTKETNLAPHLALCPLSVYTHCSRRHRQDITVKDSQAADSGASYCLKFHDKKNPGRVVYMLRLQGKVLEVFSLQFVVMGWFGWVSQLAIAGLGKGVGCGFRFCPV